MTRDIFKTILLLCALLCFIFAISSCGEVPRSTHPAQQDVDTPKFSMPQAIRVIPGNDWPRWISGDSIIVNGFGALSMDNSNGKQVILTDTSVLRWLVAVLPDSLALSGYADTLRLSNDTLYISGQNYVLLSDYLDNTDAQTLSLITNTLSITGGNSVSLAAYLDNTDGQILSFSNPNLSISGGNSVDLSALSGGGGVAQDLISNDDSLLISSGDGVPLNQINYWYKNGRVYRIGRDYAGSSGVGADGIVVVADTVDNNNGSGNARAYKDGSVVSRSGVIGYNSYDAEGKYVGSNNFDHYSGFQARFRHSGTGTVSNAYGFNANMVVDGGGTITTLYNYRGINPTVTSGTIGTLYNFYAPTLNAAGTNYALYIDQSNQSRIGGNAIIGNLTYETSSPWKLLVTDSMIIQTASNLSATANPNMLVLNRNNGGVGMVHSISFQVTDLEFAKIGAGTLGGGDSRLSFYTTTSGGNATVENMRLSHDGELWIGFTSDQGSQKVQVNGSILASTIKLTGVPTYADDSAAGSGGLTAGDVYKTATGELRIKL